MRTYKYEDLVSLIWKNTLSVNRGCHCQLALLAFQAQRHAAFTRRTLEGLQEASGRCRFGSPGPDSGQAKRSSVEP